MTAPIPMDPRPWIDLATVVIQVLEPVIAAIVNAYASGRDAVDALAAESVATILRERGHLDVAQALAHADRAAEALRAARARGDLDALPDRALAYVAHALAIHDLASTG